MSVSSCVSSSCTGVIIAIMIIWISWFPFTCAAFQGKMPSKDLLQDLVARFILNCPPEELQCFERMLFLVEQVSGCRSRADPPQPPSLLRTEAHVRCAPGALVLRGRLSREGSGAQGLRPEGLLSSHFQGASVAEASPCAVSPAVSEARQGWCLPLLAVDAIVSLQASMDEIYANFMAYKASVPGVADTT